MAREATEQYRVLSNTPEVPGVCTLALELASGGGGDSPHGVPEFVAGQFITVYFSDIGTPEGKAYSISSASGGSSFSITVRGIGEFSNRLCALRPGDVITASLPYGYFSSVGDGALVLIAAGIGIAPFRSIIWDTLRKNPDRKITLFYTSRSFSDIVFKNEFDTLQASNPNFTVRYFVTRETEVPAGAINRRISAEDITVACCDHLGGVFADAEFLICGSISFVRDLWRGLKANGVPEDAIYTEAFFS